VLDSYPVVILNGEVTLSASWGKRLVDYLERGGTLIVCDDQLKGAGVTALKLPDLGAVAEDSMVVWQPTKTKVASQRFRYRPTTGGRALATTTNGDTIASVFERGKGRLVFLSVPRGLGIDEAATPLVGLVLTHARQGLLPLDVEGEVEWLLNRTSTGWLLTLLNPAGNNRSQHGIAATHYGSARGVTIRMAGLANQAADWFTGTTLEARTEQGRSVFRFALPAGSLRVVDIEMPGK
jgi:hypothetical protein